MLPTFMWLTAAAMLQNRPAFLGDHTAYVILFFVFGIVRKECVILVRVNLVCFSPKNTQNFKIKLHL